MRVGAAAALIVGMVASILIGEWTDAHAQSGNQRLIRQALAAAPAHIAKNAAVVAPDKEGKMTELRAGTNGFTCMPDNPDSPGKDPMCVDQIGMKWLQAYVSHASKPDTDGPGVAYMLQGGSDISANDPWAKPDTRTKFVASPPHWMVLWPFDAKESGLPTTPKKTGSWIMWSGTPYAHLMVNQVP